MVNIAAVNPWTWQDVYGFSQAVDVTGAQRMLFCAGQTSVDAEGNPLHTGDMANQVAQALDNVETVLAQAGFGLSHVVRLNWYTTECRCPSRSCRCSGRTIGESRLRAVVNAAGSATPGPPRSHGRTGVMLGGWSSVSPRARGRVAARREPHRCPSSPLLAAVRPKPVHGGPAPGRT